MAYLNRHGSVTIFMIIILPVVIVACVLLTDACLYDSGKRTIENSVDASAYSVLGKYSGYLKGYYDMYAYCMSTEAAAAIALDNLEINLDENSIYDFKVEQINVSEEGAITDPIVLLTLLEKTAADDVYKGLVDEFTERFDILSGVKGTAEIITLKMKLDKSYQKIKDSMVALNKIINGDGDLEYYVNLAGFDSRFSKAVELFNQYRYDLASIESELEAITEEFKDQPSEKAGIKTILEEQAGVLREKAAEVYTSFIEGFIKGLKDANKEAIEHIRDIVVENKNIHILSETIRERVAKADECPVYLKEILFACTDLVNDIEDAFVEQVFEEIRIVLDNNISALSNLEETFFETIEEGNPTNGKVDIACYNPSVYYSYEEDAKAGMGEDRRSFFEELGKKVLEKQIKKDMQISKSIILPSNGLSDDKEQFDVTSLGEDTDSGEREIVDFSDKLESDSFSIFNNLIINEYILQHFGHENSSNDTLPSSRFFNNEIEYIIWGNRSQNYNNLYTKAAILSTRFALDAMHVFTDSQKIAKADAIAVATAGWWTMGAGIPVMSNLVKISWAIAEAGMDTKKLWQGENLAVIKTAGDWITDIGVADKSISSPDFLKMDYGDYLRLYLMTVPLETKLIRLLDIVSLNSPAYFKPGQAFSKITVTAVVSFRSLTGGRHEIEVSATASY